MRILAISSADGGAAAAIVQDGIVIAAGTRPAEHGLAASLPGLVAGLLAEHGTGIALVAAIVGPGSFTGLRAGLSVAHGAALGYGVAVSGVTVAEALAHEAAQDGGPGLLGRELWTAIHARPGRVFIDRPAGLHGFSTAAIPAANGRVALAGNAANLVAATLAASGTDVMLTRFRIARAVDVAGVARARLSAGLPPAPALPLYVDRPEARLPKAGLRAAPLGALAAISPT